MFHAQKKIQAEYRQLLLFGYSKSLIINYQKRIRKKLKKIRVVQKQYKQEAQYKKELNCKLKQ